MVHGLSLSLALVAASSLVAVAFAADAPLIRDAFGLSEFEVGAIASCVYLGAVASSIHGGRFTDRWGAGPVLVAVYLLLAAGSALAALAPVGWLFFVGVLVVGLGYGAVNPPTNVLANSRTARRRALMISLKQSGVPLGGALAGLVIPALAVRAGWRISLLAPVVVCLVLAMVTIAWWPAADAPAAEDYVRPDTVRLRGPHAFAFGFIMCGVQVVIFTFLALYLVDARGLSAGRAGALLALLLVGGVIGRLAWGWLSDVLHHDRARVLQVNAVLSVVTLCLLPFVGGRGLLVLLPAIGLCSVGWNGVYLTAVSEMGTPQEIGRITGRSMLAVNSGAVVIPPLFGQFVTSYGGWTLPWLACAALALASVGVIELSRAVSTVPTTNPAAAGLALGRDHVHCHEGR